MTTMKLFSLALILAGGLSAQCSSMAPIEAVNFAVTANVAASSVQSPAVDGAPAAVCRIGISLQTTDPNAVFFSVTLAVELTDGKTWQGTQLVGRTATQATYVEFWLPAGAAPTEITRLDVARLHQQPTDVLLQPGRDGRR